MIALIAISHTGYLTAKAIPRSKADDGKSAAPTAQAPGAVPASDDHPAMG